MNDCSRCWECPCACGWDYRDKPVKELIEYADIFQTLIEFKELHGIDQSMTEEQEEAYLQYKYKNKGKTE